MSYSEFLQTVSTITGVVGVGTAVYVSVIANRLHRAVNVQTKEVTDSIKEQTNELKP